MSVHVNNSNKFTGIEKALCLFGISQMRNGFAFRKDLNCRLFEPFSSFAFHGANDEKVVSIGATQGSPLREQPLAE